MFSAGVSAQDHGFPRVAIGDLVDLLNVARSIQPLTAHHGGCDPGHGGWKDGQPILTSHHSEKRHCGGIARWMTTYAGYAGDSPNAVFAVPYVPDPSPGSAQGERASKRSSIQPSGVGDVGV